MSADRGRRATGRRAVWNVVDQVVSSLSNAAVTIVVARSVPADAFGRFAIAFTLSLLVLSAVRQLVNAPFLLMSSASTGAAFRREAREAGGAAVTWGVLLGAPVALCGLLLGGTLGAAVVAAGVTLPLLFWQDVLRYVGQAAGRPQDAALSDTVWLAALAVALGVLVGTGETTAWVYVAAWSGTAAVAAAVATARLGWLPALHGGLRWTWDRRDTSRWLLLEILAAYGSVQVVVLVVAALAGTAAAGAWRGVQTLLGPVNVLGMAARSFLVPELVRRPDLAPSVRLRAAAALSGVLVVANLGYGGVLLALPQDVGEQVLGETWTAARTVLLPLTVWSAAVGVSLGPLAVLQTLGRTRAAAGVSLLLAPLLLVAALVGLLLGGSVAAAYGVMAAQLAVAPVWWVTMRRAVADAARARSTVSVDAPLD